MTDGIKFGQGMKLPDGYLEVSGCSSLYEARLKVLNCAVCSGYKRPTRWQKLLGAIDYFELFGIKEEEILK